MVHLVYSLRSTKRPHHGPPVIVHRAIPQHLLQPPLVFIAVYVVVESCRRDGQVGARSRAGEEREQKKHAW